MQSAPSKRDTFEPGTTSRTPLKRTPLGRELRVRLIERQLKGKKKGWEPLLVSVMRELTVCSLDNHTRFQTIMDKIYTRFQVKTTVQPYSLGWHTNFIAYTMWFAPAPHPPPPRRHPSLKETPTLNTASNNTRDCSMQMRILKTIQKEAQSSLDLPQSRGPNSKVSLLNTYFLCTISSGLRYFRRCGNTTRGSRLMVGKEHTPRQNS